MATDTRRERTERIPGAVYWVAPLVLGLLVRSAFLPTAFGIDLHFDERAYAKLARGLIATGSYIANPSADYIFPPGYPFFLSLFLRVSPQHGLDFARVAQVLFSPVIGVLIMIIARRIFNARTALLAGFFWALYLPLVGFSHLLWSENLFLLFFLAFVSLFGSYIQGRGEARSDLLRLGAAGLFLALAMFVREAALFFVPVAIGWILYVRRARPTRGIAHAAILVAILASVLAPWTIRNQSVHNSFVPVAITFGINGYKGLNGRYHNNDLQRHDMKAAYPKDHPVRRLLIPERDDGWRLSKKGSLIERDRENTRRALTYAVAHPVFIATTRIKKLADFFTPLSFIVRNLRISNYRSWLETKSARRIVSIAAVLEVTFVMLTAFWVIVPARGDPVGTRFLLSIMGYFVLTGLLVSMSRYRVPIVPILIIWSAHAVTGGARQVLDQRAARWRGGVAVCLLGFLWLINADGVLHILQQIW